MTSLFTASAISRLLMGWIPLSTLLGAMLLSLGRLTLLDVVVQAPLLAVLYTLMIRASVYSARSLPLRRDRMLPLAAIHIVAAGIASAVWVSVTAVVSLVLGSVETVVQPVASLGEYLIVFVLGVLSYLGVMAAVYLTRAAEASHEAREQASLSRSLALAAELKALRAQLNPHFLFNSLNSIAALTAIDGRSARQMTVSLSEFLRMSLALGNRSTIQLSEELALVDAYLKVEAIRFEDRMRVSWQVDEGAKALAVPPLLLQPLVENAVKHGVAGLDRGGSIRVDIRQQGAALVIEVENPFDPRMPRNPKSGHGLRIVEKRLESHYGRAAHLDTERREGDLPVFAARLVIPVNPKEVP